MNRNTGFLIGTIFGIGLNILFALGVYTFVVDILNKPEQQGLLAYFGISFVFFGIFLFIILLVVPSSSRPGVFLSYTLNSLIRTGLVGYILIAVAQPQLLPGAVPELDPSNLDFTATLKTLRAIVANVDYEALGSALMEKADQVFWGAVGSIVGTLFISLFVARS